MSLLNNEIILIKRKSAGEYVDGHYVEGRESHYQIKASIQPLAGRELLQLPEADRMKESLKVLSATEVKINDVVVRSGKSYKVQKVMDYSNARPPHYEAVMLLIEGQ